MPKFAQFDSKATQPTPVVGFYDTDEHDYPNLPATTELIEMTEAEWVSRMGAPLSVLNGLLIPTPPPSDTVLVGMQATRARLDRNARIAAVQWRYERYAREMRLKLKPTDDISTLDAYVQALANITDQTGFPASIDWPVSP